MGSLIREYRLFPNGSTFKPTETFNNIADGTSVTLHDPGPIYEAPPAGSSADYCVYSRLFWNVAGTISTSASVNVKVQGTTIATCWYQHGCSPGGGGVAIVTFAFDVDANTEMAGTTPIGSVTPSSLWTSPSNSVTPATSGTVTIDAKDSINGKPFDKWLLFGAGSASSDDVVIPAKQGGFYIAFYKKPKGPGLDLGFLGDLFAEVVPGLDIDWVVDPSPLDRVRLALIASKLAAQSAAQQGAAGLDAGAARKELARVKSEIKGLEARAGALESQINKASKR